MSDFLGSAFGGLGADSTQFMPPKPVGDQMGGSPALVLAGEDFRRFRWRFDNALENSKSKMSDLHARAELDRKVYRTVPREPMYRNGPDVTTGLSADFTDGLYAHIRDAIEQRPFASFTPESRGVMSNSDAHEVAAVYTAYMEREINRSGSRRALAQALTQEASVVGTGIVRFTLAEHADGELFVQAGSTIRFENFFVDRIAVDDLKDTFCAYRYKRRLYQLEADADDGLLDKDAVARLRDTLTDTEKEIPEEEEQNFNESDSAFEEENQLITLYRGYMRFRPQGERRSILYECIFDERRKLILSLQENPAGKAYDHPPIALVRIGRQAGYLFGRSIPQRLQSEQKVADNAINTHLALNDKVAAPPIQYNINNPIAEGLRKAGRILEPGMWLPSYGAPDRPDVWQMQFSNPGYALQDWNLSQQMAQRRTFDDQVMGTSSSTRKTLGQVQSELNKGTLKLHLDLADVAYDMGSMVLPMYWSMVVAYKIDREGIVSVGTIGKLLAKQDIPGQEFADAVISEGTSALVSGEIGMEDLVPLESQLNSMFVENRVPSAHRQDITISLTGTQIIADKIGELDKELQMMPQLLNLIQAAQQDTFINYWGRSILRRAGFTDIGERWPEDPGIILEQAQAQQAAAAQQGGQPAAPGPDRAALLDQFNQFAQSQSAR